MKASIFIRYFCGSVAVLLLWQLGSVTLGSDILPDPLRALGGFWDALKDPEFIGHIGLSLYRLLSALALAIVVSFPLGVLLGHSKAADWLGAPVTFITLPLPKIVLLPVFFTILGLGDSSRILLIALATGYQILVIVRESALALNPSYELAMRSMGGCCRTLSRRKFCYRCRSGMVHHECLGTGRYGRYVRRDSRHVRAGRCALRGHWSSRTSGLSLGIAKIKGLHHLSA
ncbi:ABC transporter permease [Sutterella wadsworthensis]|uniref:ABC transporter permease n=1 Tax=Sutterella wadsworthensis TaxID=40545 RepID=UPI003AB9629E